MATIKNMRNKTTRFLVASLIMVLALCVLVFSFLAITMDRRSTRTINEVRKIYMDSMSEQIALHFATTINLRLSQWRPWSRPMRRDTPRAARRSWRI